MRKNISVSTIKALLEDRKKGFNYFMEKGDYAFAHDLRNEALGIAKVLSMSLTDIDPITYHDFYEEVMNGLEKNSDMMKWELDHLR